jgi:hypothetical protein
MARRLIGAGLLDCYKAEALLGECHSMEERLAQDVVLRALGGRRACAQAAAAVRHCCARDVGRLLCRLVWETRWNEAWWPTYTPWVPERLRIKRRRGPK